MESTSVVEAETSNGSLKSIYSIKSLFVKETHVQFKLLRPLPVIYCTLNDLSSKNYY